MQINNGKGLQKFKGLISSLLMLCILATGLGVTAYGYDNYDTYNYLIEDALSPEDVAEPVTIAVGESISLHLPVTGDVRWTSANRNIVTVDNKGVITGVTPGNTLVMALPLTPEPGEIMLQYFNVTVVPEDEKVTVAQVSAGYMHTMALRSDGSLWAWGLNATGAVGNSYEQVISEPLHIMDNIKQISAGGHHSLAVTNDGRLYAWGLNSFGQVGNGSTQNAYSPVYIMDNVKYAHASSSNSFVITNDGNLYGWGNNLNGQVGSGSTEINVLMPEYVKSNVKQVAGGRDYNIAITNNGTLYAWGLNVWNTFGDPTLDRDFLTTTPVKIMDGVDYISAGPMFTLAIKEDSSLWVWGSNEFGQIGNGERTNNPPVSYPYNPMNNVGVASAGGMHTLAIDHNATLYTWGMNLNGQLGNGSTEINGVEVSTPQAVKRNVAYATGGLSHSAAITIYGELYTWGSNLVGQLGHGAGMPSTTSPKRVTFPN